MKIVPLHQRLEKLCFRSSGDVIMLQDGSGPWMVGTINNAPVKPHGSSGLFESGADKILLIHIVDGRTIVQHLSTRVAFFPDAAVHLGEPR